VRQLPGVDYAEPVLDVPCTFSNGPYSRRGGIMGMVPHARLTTPRDGEGRPVRIPEVSLAMSRTMAEILHVGRGDRVSVQFTKGKRQLRSVPIGEITDGYLGMSVYANLDYLSTLIDEEECVTGIQLAIDPRYEPRRLLNRELKKLPGIQAVNARADFVRNLQDTVIKTQRIFIGMLIMFAGVIFFNSILNSSLISLAERGREVATMRVLGYGPWQIGNLFLRESMVVNLLGTLLGMPLGYKLCEALALSYENDLFRIPVVTKPWIWVSVFLLAVAFGLVAHAVVQRKIFTADWQDELKVKE
jgi:putative ABC transport system permease protein